MIWMNGVRTVCGSHTPHTLMKEPNYGKGWRRKPQGRTQQSAHGIKLKTIVTGGVEWPKSWPRSLGGNGGGVRSQKP
jgi:nitrate reductase beta subunit